MPLSFPASPTVGQTSVQNGRTYQWDGTTWSFYGSVNAHAQNHASGGSDAVSPASIGAAAASHTHASTDISDSTAAGRAIITAADAAAQRTALSVQPTASPTFTGVVTVPAGSAAAPSVTITGDTNTGIAQVGGADTLGITTGGVERLRVGSDGSQTSVIPGGSTLLPQFACRAWVNFNGTGTVAIRGSGNVTSITDNNTGDYTVNFTTNMPDANYAWSLSGHRGDTAGFNAGFITAYATASNGYTSATTSALRITTYTSASTGALDWPAVVVAVFR